MPRPLGAPRAWKVGVLAFVAAAALLGLRASSSQATAGPLTVTFNAWTVVGLDSNSPSSSTLPHLYPVGAKVCNTGSSSATNVVATWTWAGGTLDQAFNGPANNSTSTIGTLAGSACQDIYFSVDVKQSGGNSSKTHNQDATITATADGSLTASATKKVYVEGLVSQNRNTTKALSGAGGCNTTYSVCDTAPTSIYVGQTYTYKLYAQTASAYDELESFVTWPSFITVKSATSTYGTYTSAGLASSNTFWSDACAWGSITTGSSGACGGSGKAGGKVVVTYSVTPTTAGSGTLQPMIYDHSGSSFHYNSGFTTALTSSFAARWELSGTVVGNGTITSSPNGTTTSGTSTGINCGTSTTTCSVGYDNNTSVTLTETPGSGQTFTGWSGGSCSGTSSTCTVTMNQSRSVTATFTGTTSYPLTVTKYGSGSVTADSGSLSCGSTCTANYSSGTTVTLTESASSGWTFGGWSGGVCSGTSPTCTVTMSAAKSVTATFNETTYTLTVAATGAGAGDLCSNNSNQSSSGLCSPGSESVFISCGSSSDTTTNYADTVCSGTYPSGGSATLYPMCNGGSSGTPCPGGSGGNTVSFGGYSGGTCTGTSTAGCAFTMDQDRSVTGNFLLGSATPDLTISKSHSGNFSQGDTGKQYTLSVSNVGTGSVASGKTITVTDTPPSGLTATAASGTGWSCSISSGTATCTQTLSSSLAAGASMNAITLTVSVASNASTPLSQTASVSCSSSCGEASTSNNSATDSTTILTPADLTITKTHTGDFSQSGTGTYTLTASNSGGQSTSGAVTVSDSLPSGFTKSSVSGSGWDCSTSTSTTITCTRSDALSAGSSYPAITLTVNVSSSAATATNTASVSGGGQSNTSNDSSSDPTTVLAHLTVSKAGNGSGTVTDNQSGISCGSTCVADYAYNTVVTLTATADTGSTFTGWSGAGCSGTGTCQVTMTQARSVTATFTLQTFTLTVSKTGTGTGSVSSSPSGITCGATCSASYDYGTSVTLTPTADSGSSFNGWSGGCTTSGTDCVATMTQDRTVSADFVVGSLPDLTISKSHTDTFRQGSSGKHYTLTVTNSGAASTSAAVTVTESAPSGLTVTAMSGTGWTCTTLPTCTRSDALGAGSSYDAITVTVDVASNAASSVTNSASVSGGGESNTSNDSASDPTTVEQVADLTIAKSHSGTFRQGDSGKTYTLTVSNGGNGATTGSVTVTESPPSGLTVTAMSGTGWSCTLATKTCTRSDALAAGGSYDDIIVTVDVASNAGSPLSNQASVSGGGELNTSNDSASDSTTIIARYTLTVSKTGSGSGSLSSSPSGIDCGSTCSASYDDGTGVTLTATADSGSTFTGWSGSGCSGTGTCAVTMSQARSVTATFEIADLTISKSHSGSFRQGDSGKTYTLTVSNGGSGPTVGTVIVTESPPSALTVTAMSGTGWSCTLATKTCTRSDALAASSSYDTITVTVDVASNAASSVTNSASVSGGGESNTSNDSASDPTTVEQVADLTIAKSHSGSFRQGDSGKTYTLTVSNGGNGPTTGSVTVTESPPSGLTVTAMSGTGWSCTLATKTCTRSDTLAAGGSYAAITVTVDVASNAASSVTNSASVSGGGELNTSNDSASDPTTVIARYTLSVSKAGSGSGTVTSDVGSIDCGSTCSAVYDSGTLVTLSASAADGSTFAGWSGACSGTGTCQVTMSQDRSVTATFVVGAFPDLTIAKSHSGSFRQGQTGAQYTLIVTNTGNGPTVGAVTVTESPPTGETVTAISGAGWSCTLATKTCTRSDALAANQSYEAILVTVDVAANAASSVTNAAGVDGGGCLSSPCSTATDPTTVIARYTLTASKAGSGFGSVTSSPSGIDCGSNCSAVYDDGTGVTLTATADSGSTFAVWSGAGCSGTGTCTMTMSQDRSVTATFDVSVTPPDNTLSGVEFNDLNADGVRQDGEPALEGWTVYVDSNGNGQPDSGEPSDVTSASGSYTIRHVALGSHAVREVGANGWKCSDPSPCRYDETFSDGANLTGRDFGNWAHALLTGHKFEDANRNGQRDSGESPLGGFKIYVDYNDNGQLDSGEPSSTSLPSGYYGITGVAAGTWSVREVSQPNWTCSSPDPCAYSITFVADSEITGRDFGNWAPARITGTKFNDRNADGFRAATDPGLPGWVVYVDYNNDGTLDAGDVSTVTGADGTYSMGVNLGTWPVREVQQEHWACSFPSSGCSHSLTFASGSILTANFGNYHLAALTGTKFNDYNANGIQDPGEPGLPGWTIYIDYNGNGQLDPGEPDAHTETAPPASSGSPIAAGGPGQNGYYGITDIHAGTYTVREVPKTGTQCTFPATCSYTQTFEPDSIITNRDFAISKPPKKKKKTKPKVVHGRAHLRAPDGCMRRTFAAEVRGRRISRVTFTVGRRLHRTVAGAHRRRYAVRIDPRRMNAGVHHIVARVQFVKASKTRPKRLVRAFYRCPARVAPPFTG